LFSKKGFDAFSFGKVGYSKPSINNKMELGVAEIIEPERRANVRLIGLLYNFYKQIFGFG